MNLSVPVTRVERELCWSYPVDNIAMRLQVFYNLWLSFFFFNIFPFWFLILEGMSCTGQTLHVVSAPHPRRKTRQSTNGYHGNLHGFRRPACSQLQNEQMKKKLSAAKNIIIYILYCFITTYALFQAVQGGPPHLCSFLVRLCRSEEHPLFRPVWTSQPED